MEAWYCCFRSVNSRALRLVVRYLNIKVTTVCCIFDPAILFCHRCCLITVICSRSGLMDEMVFSLQCWLANTFDSCSQRNLTFVFLKVFSVILRTFWWVPAVCSLVGSLMCVWNIDILRWLVNYVELKPSRSASRCVLWLGDVNRRNVEELGWSGLFWSVRTWTNSRRFPCRYVLCLRFGLFRSNYNRCRHLLRCRYNFSFDRCWARSSLWLSGRASRWRSRNFWFLLFRWLRRSSRLNTSFPSFFSQRASECLLSVVLQLLHHPLFLLTFKGTVEQRDKFNQEPCFDFILDVIWLFEQRSLCNDLI